MNYIKHLSGFFNKSNQDVNITPTHVSLYFALFQRWNLNRFRNPIIISRAEIMIAAKIKSKATYHKCIRELHQNEYIIYKPSFNSYEGTEVILPDLSSINSIEKEEKNCRTNSERSTTTGSSFDRSGSNNDQSNSNFDTPCSTNELAQKFSKQTGSTNEPTIEKTSETTTNTQKTKELYEPSSSAVKPTIPTLEQGIKKAHTIYNNSYNNINSNKYSVVEKNQKNQKESPKKVVFAPPTLPETTSFFIEKNANTFEAQKFHNYYSSNGWLVGGKSKMKDWQAAARNWILNMEKYKPIQNESKLAPKNLHVSNNKNYAEPL